MLCGGLLHRPRCLHLLPAGPLPAPERATVVSALSAGPLRQVSDRALVSWIFSLETLPSRQNPLPWAEGEVFSRWEAHGVVLPQHLPTVQNTRQRRREATCSPASRRALLQSWNNYVPVRLTTGSPDPGEGPGVPLVCALDEVPVGQV